jgi:hypothetical protein
MAELAISLAVLLLILAGILDLGRLYFVYIALEDGAGEAALYLSIFPNCPADPNPTVPGDMCDDPNNAFYRAKTAGGGELVDWSDPAIARIDYVIPPNWGVGTPVEVTIEYDYTFLTPIIPHVSGVNPITLTVKARQIILTES